MKSKKLGMTLIEILVVVGIIGVIAGISIPKVSNSRLESRDILRLSQIQEIGSAITSYGIDHGGYPVSTGTCISTLTELVDEGYLNKIDPDPNDEKIVTSCKKLLGGQCVLANDNICTGGYYNYVSNGSRFVLAAYMENNKNGNYICLNQVNCNDDCTYKDKTHLCQDLAKLGSGGELSEFLSNNRLNDGLKSNIYVYLRQ